MKPIVIENIIENLAVGLLVIDPDGEIILANKAAASILGFTGETITGRGWADLFLCGENDLFNQVIVDVIWEQELNLRRTVPYVRGDGEVLQLSMTTSFIRTDRELVGIVVLLHDVTEIHTCYLHEKEILEDKNRLQKERTESLNKLAISVAHQLRNPTTAIGGFAGLLLKKADPDTFPAKYLESIVTSAGRLEDLVRSVRDYTSLPPVTLRRVPVSVFHEPIERRVRQKAAELSREVDVIFGGESFEVSIDPGLVEEALNEILDNAVESMTAGHGTVEVSITPEENSFLITIQDNGSGIPEENLPYVFDPFFTTKAVGIGMGLCLARQIITEHNGCIWIERSELSGTKVMIRIPRKAAFSIAKKGELEMEILDEIVGEVLVLKLKGRLDSTSAASLKDKVKDCVNKGRIFLVIDMTNIDFVDSSGLGSLVACLRSVNKMGGDIRIAGLQNRVRVVFELIRLHHIFEIFDNAENAVRDFQTSTKGAAT